MTLYYEDVAEGDELPELTKGPITHIGLVRYSGAAGDFNPIHTVPEVAVRVGLDGIIAHGMLIMAYAGKMITDWADPDVMRQFKVRFSGMTEPGEEVVAAATIKRKFVDEESGERLVQGRLTVKGAADDSLKIKGDFTVALPSRKG